MMKFNSKIAAGVLAGLGLVYMVGSLATGRDALAQFPAELDVDGETKGMDVWQAANLLVKNKGSVAIIDLRPKKAFGQYNLPGSINHPEAGSAKIKELVEGKKALIIARTDSDAIRSLNSITESNVHYLKGGAGSWYLAFDLPIALFSEKEKPFGYEDALGIAKAYFSGGQIDSTDVLEAIATLSRLNYEPTLLKQAGKPASSGSKRKKISGGCG